MIGDNSVEKSFCSTYETDFVFSFHMKNIGREKNNQINQINGIGIYIRHFNVFLQTAEKG